MSIALVWTMVNLDKVTVKYAGEKDGTKIKGNYFRDFVVAA